MAFPGGCLCGVVRYEIDRKFLNAMHCYCRMCRKAHGTAFSTHVITRPEQIKWSSGRDEIQAFESSPRAYREFCSHCGTHVLVHGQSDDGTHAIPAGTLDGDPAVTILGHMYTDELVSWFQIADGFPQHRGWPPT